MPEMWRTHATIRNPFEVPDKTEAAFRDMDAGRPSFNGCMGCFRCRADDHGSCHGCSCPCDRWINPRLSKCGPACVSPWSEFPLATPEPQESSNG